MNLVQILDCLWVIFFINHLQFYYTLLGTSRKKKIFTESKFTSYNDLKSVVTCKYRWFSLSSTNNV